MKKSSREAENLTEKIGKPPPGDAVSVLFLSF
jgi:hypothetical protein